MTRAMQRMTRRATSCELARLGPLLNFVGLLRMKARYMKIFYIRTLAHEWNLKGQDIQM